jgi:hypothetical protein
MSSSRCPRNSHADRAQPLGRHRQLRGLVVPGHGEEPDPGAARGAGSRRSVTGEDGKRALAPHERAAPGSTVRATDRAVSRAVLPDPGPGVKGATSEGPSRSSTGKGIVGSGAMNGSPVRVTPSTLSTQADMAPYGRSSGHRRRCSPPSRQSWPSGRTRAGAGRCSPSAPAAASTSAAVTPAPTPDPGRGVSALVRHHHGPTLAEPVGAAEPSAMIPGPGFPPGIPVPAPGGRGGRPCRLRDGQAGPGRPRRRGRPMRQGSPEKGPEMRLGQPGPHPHPCTRCRESPAGKEGKAPKVRAGSGPYGRRGAPGPGPRAAAPGTPRSTR